jgi:hypothetical protein
MIVLIVCFALGLAFGAFSVWAGNNQRVLDAWKNRDWRYDG